jgi:hypothetical protein
VGAEEVTEPFQWPAVWTEDSLREARADNKVDWDQWMNQQCAKCGRAPVRTFHVCKKNCWTCKLDVSQGHACRAYHVLGIGGSLLAKLPNTPAEEWLKAQETHMGMPSQDSDGCPAHAMKDIR